MPGKRKGQGRISMHVRLEPDLAARVRADAAAAGRSMSEQIEWIIETNAAWEEGFCAGIASMAEVVARTSTS